MRNKSKILGIALLCLTFGIEALTLGRARGSALLGQALDVTFDIQMDAGEQATALCFDADVFHADTRQDPARVRVLVEAMASVGMARLRVLSSTPVDEPVVTVYLRTGCGQQTSRRYVLLADLPSNVDAPPASLLVPKATPAPAKADWKTPAAIAPVVAPVVTAPSVRADVTPKPKPRRGPASTDTQSKPAPAPARRASPQAVARQAATAGRPRLKLDPLELLSDRIADLGSSALFPPSEDALLNFQKIQKMEGDIKALLAAAAKNQASLMDLRARLQNAEAERFPVGVVYTLVALVLGCLAALAFFWSRQRRGEVDSQARWSESLMQAEPAIQPAAPPVGRSASRAPAVAVHPGADDSGLASLVDVRMLDMSNSDFSALVRHDTPEATKPEPPPLSKASLEAPPRPTHSIASDAVLDLCQQAEFFVSLGRTDEAVQMLKKQIGESSEPNPLVYLDLLDLLHSLGLETDFNQYRQNFIQLFNGKVPEFAFFMDEGMALESCPDVLDRITQAWATPEVLEIIESCIYRDPWAQQNRAFDLAALRELLLLQAIAQDLIAEAQPQRDDPQSLTLELD